MQAKPSHALGPELSLPLDQPFTRRTALAAGLRDKQLGALVTAGYLRRPIPGVYVASQLPDSINLRASVLALVVPAGSFVCDRTAAWLHGAPMALAPNEHLSVPPVSCFRPADAGRLRNGLATSGERTVAPGDLMHLNGVLVTTPLRTALDLGRLQRTRDLALGGMDAMLRLRRFSHDELLEAVPRFRRQRGVRQPESLAPLADGRAESFGESALRRRWLDAGLPRPQLQIPILENGRVIFWLDMGLEEWLFAAEYDGAAWHSSPEQVAADNARRSWLDEQRRWAIEVFRQEHVWGLRQDADLRLAAAFRRARATFASRTFII
jgi:hypothetical protein